MKIIVLGGGTIQHIRNHLALCAPAYGSTARMIHEKLQDLKLSSQLVLTKMADSYSELVTNEDVANYLSYLVNDPDVKVIILNVAFCDYKAYDIDGIPCDSHAERLKTEDGDINITLTPTDKIIQSIREARPDIFLVGFKTTTNKSSEEQFLTGLKMMKKTHCNLVLCNDTVTRNNFVITPEETIYGETTVRKDAIQELCEIIKLRHNLTYNKVDFTYQQDLYYVSDLDFEFRKVIQFLIENGGFIENNGNGFTPGHFCQLYNIYSDKLIMMSSQRKANHNNIFDEKTGGVTVVKYFFDGHTKAIGRRKPSVGARSQIQMFLDHPQYNAIIHTHNPLKEGSLVPIASQRPYQCGSLECGINTSRNLKFFPEYNLSAVYLDKHGINIMYNIDEVSYRKVIEFIQNNVQLGVKTT